MLSNLKIWFGHKQQQDVCEWGNFCAVDAQKFSLASSTHSEFGNCTFFPQKCTPALFFTNDKSSHRNLLDLRDGNDDGVCDHDGHGSQLLLPRSSANGSSPLGSQVSTSHNFTETCDLWDIQSEWSEDMTGPTEKQWRRLRQLQRQKHLEIIFKGGPRDLWLVGNKKIKPV